MFTSEGSKIIYDSFYVRRCYQCQRFGHIAKDCKFKEACGKCAGEHRNNNCTLESCCVNCKLSGLGEDDCKHSSFSLSCPSHLKEQAKLKKSIAFYNQKN